jgi:hypothetical protein
MSRKKIPHFRFYPTDFLDGTHSMTASEVGDYVRILAWLYDQDGSVLYQPQVLRFLLRCVRSVDADKRVRRLIALGKLSLDANGFLRNGRVEKELQKRRDWQEKHPEMRPQTPGVSALKPPATSAKKPMKTMGAGTLARASPWSNLNLSKLVPSFHAREPTNGSALQADGARGLEGRAPQPNGRAPPPDKEWPPPSHLKERVYGKTAAKPNPKPGNGTQPGRHRRRPRKAAPSSRAAEDKPGAQKGAENESPHPRRS